MQALTCTKGEAAGPPQRVAAEQQVRKGPAAGTDHRAGHYQLPSMLTTLSADGTVHFGMHAKCQDLDKTDSKKLKPNN